MKVVNSILILALTVVISVGAAVVTIRESGWLDQNVEFLVVRPKAVITAFIEQRSLVLEDGEMAAALQVFDAAVTDEANRIFYSSGVIIINADHVLAGGTDITDDFIELVLAEWDRRQ